LSVPQLVEVHFKGQRKAYFEWHEAEPLRATEPVIVESERGVDYGVVSAIGAVAKQKCDRCQGCAIGEKERGGDVDTARRAPEPTRKVVRRASATDRRTHEDLRKGEDDVRRKVREKADAHNLPMKVSDAEWQWDRNKLTVFFTAEKRVDFRALVRELASQFRTRIELRQIGVRDEAARLGGIGRCGRELCSATFLTELRPIGLHIAKDQRLSLNPAQISGPCGRLLCCLRFEHEFYVQSRKRFPKEGKVLATSKGFEKVHSVDIFRDRVTVRTEDGTFRTVPLADLKAETAQGRVASGAAPGTAGTAVAEAPPRTEGRREQPRNEGRRQTDRPGGRQGGERRDQPREDRRERPRNEGSVPAAPVQGAATPPATTPAGGEPATGEPTKRRRRRRRRRGPRGPGAPGSPDAQGGATPPGSEPPAADGADDGDDSDDDTES
jgi:cell fate regulator YaaT (PSP1 superfamily)